ncbi:MAG TPA: Uma2 family endonuclease [Candidatus Dormibacteraeota bacterium]|nr:Uma2 family endonuclease [Candidatus Dormibacteraeota bacterium]
MARTSRTAHANALTYRDLWHTPDDGNRWEIIGGEVFVTPAPFVPHQDVVLNLATLLRTHTRAHRLGRVFVSPIAVVLERPSGVQPDLVFVSRARRGIIQEKGIFGAPDLIVEVTSPSTATRDRGMKLDLYARVGVRYYWLVDPRRGTLRALRLEGHGYAIEAELGRRGTFVPSLFPRLTVRMRDVLAT